MSPRSSSRSLSPRRSHSRSSKRRSRSRRNPPSPPSLTLKRNSSRYSRVSRSDSRSVSSSYKKRHNSRRDTRSRSRTKSRLRSRSRSRSRSSHEKKRNTREKPFPSRCIGVFGLNVYTTQLQIREIFGKYGPIERIQVVVDAQTGRSRGFCFIYYETLADAKAACDNCCGMDIDGRRIRVAYSITERPHTPTPGVYKGQSARVLREHYRSRQQQLKRYNSPSSYSKNRRGRYERSSSRSRSHSPRYRH